MMAFRPHVPSCKYLLVLVYFLTVQSCSSGEIQCPQQPVTQNPDGTLTFGSFPPGSSPLNASYNPGAIGGWYSLASGFVNVVRPGSLPYDEIRSTLNGTGIQCNVGTKTGCSSSSSFNFQETLTSFVTWWVGLIVLTVIGGLLGFCFCVCGMCFCCCRCCGKCGGSKTQEISDNMNFKTFIFSAILLLFVLLLFVGVVLAFFSNQQTYESLNDAQSSLNKVAELGVNYINDTLNELNTLVCQLAAQNGVAAFVVEAAEEFNSTLQNVTGDIQADVGMIFSNITDLSPGYNETISALQDLSNSSSAARSSGAMLTATLSNITMAVATLRTDCGAALGGSGPACNQIPSEALTTEANFSQIPDINQELGDVRQALNNINLQDSVQEGRQEFSNIRENIEATVSTNIGDGVTQLQNYNESLFGLISNLTTTVESYIDNSYDISSCPTNYFDGLSDIENNVGYLRQCVVNRGFEFIQQYDVYRYAFGIIICSLALVTTILIFVGIMMGMIGFRKDCIPEERSGLSHCGGIFLIIGAIATFAFGFVLLILCCVFFFFGSATQKFCQAVEDPNYPLFVEIIDNQEFWGGSLLGTLVFAGFNSTKPELYLNEIFGNCRGNEGLYSAANLSFLLQSGNISQQINDVANLDDIKQMLEGVLSNATNDFIFNDTSFLPQNAQNALEEFRNASVDQINITAFRDQIDARLVTFNITSTIVQLQAVDTMLQSVPSSINVTQLMTDIQSIIANLENLRDVQIPTIMSQVNTLEEDVNHLVNLTDTVVMNTTVLVDDINSVVQNITGQTLPRFLNESVAGAIDRVFKLLDRYIFHIDTQLSQNVGRCRPLWIIYMEIYNTACRNFLDGLNGFWWSLGFCAVMFVPIIILSIITSNYFLKKRSQNIDGVDDYPMKSY